jgi:uncharacterized phage protein gp47/JayE
MIKTKDQILQDMTGDVISETDLVTYFGKDGAVRGILNAAANALVEAWTDIFQIKRGLFVTTAAGDDLDLLASRWELIRLGANTSSAILLFNGPAETVIPVNTIVVSSVNSSLQYQTLSAITLGAANPNIQRPINAASIGDIVLSESLTTGGNTQVASNELAALLIPITGVTVTNLAPSQGGADAESDEDLRTRILSQIDLLAQGTQAFYEACARAANETVLLSKPLLLSNSSIIVSLVKNNLSDYTAGDLTAIADYIYANQRALQKITCINASRKSIEISGPIFLQSGYSPITAFANIATKIADYVASVFDFGAAINYNNLITEVMKAEGVIGIDLSGFFVNNARDNVQCGAEEVPVFTYLGILDTLNNITTQPITQSYLII